MSVSSLTRAVEHRLSIHGCTPPSNHAFSIYRVYRHQRLLDVPLVKPVLMAVLKGLKRYGDAEPTDVTEGRFLFVSESPQAQMRNIPKTDVYLALLVEFAWSDFDTLRASRPSRETPASLCAELTDELCLSLEQLVDGGDRMPDELVVRRRQELLWILQRAGHEEVADIGREPRMSSQVFALLAASMENPPAAAEIAQSLAVSESTLRRRLQAEGMPLQAIRDQVRMGLGLHLLQTSGESVAQIALRCGYQSQSRFSSRFKQRFGITPHELRRTRLTETGEHLRG